METITIENDIKVFNVTAESFPEGIMEAYKKLNEKIPLSSVKRIFGLSRPEIGIWNFGFGIYPVLYFKSFINC